LFGLLLTGCATTIANYKIDNAERPQMSFSEAIRVFHSLSKAANTEYGIITGGIIYSDHMTVTGDIYLYGKIIASAWAYPFGQIKQFTVSQANGRTLLSDAANPSVAVCLDSPNDAKRLVDAFIALKYYFSRRFFVDDAVAFSDFREKAKTWRTLPVKPALPEEVLRFRVQAEDAFNNKQFHEAAEYYEHGLAVEPLWPQGQFNAALLEGELQWYGMAAYHMKRYLELCPDDKDAKAAREKLYLWEGKIK